MDLSSNFIQLIQDVVLRPNFASAVVLFVVTLINESFSVLPYSVILPGQLLLLEGPLSTFVFVKLSLFVAVPVGLGAALGSLPIYGLAYFGGKPAIERFGKYFRVSWNGIEKMESKFKGSWYDEILFLILRSIPLMPSLPINAAAGILRMRLAPYLVLTVAGNIIKMLVMFMFVGFGVEVLAG